MNKLSLMTLIVFVVASCSKSGVELTKIPNNLTDVVVSVSTGSDIDSRVVVDDTWSVSWSDGESLLGWSQADNYLSEFVMSDFSASYSTFEGGVSGQYYRLIVPYSAYAVISDGYYTVDIKSQTSGAGTIHMVSDEVLSVDGYAAAPMMKHVGAAMTLNINFSNYDSSSLILKSVELCDVPVAIEVNLNAAVSDSDFYGKDTLGAICVNLDQGVAVDQNVSVKLNILPFSVESGASVTIGLNFEDSDGKSYSATTSVTNSGTASVEFARATYNTINCSYDLGDLSSDDSECTLSSLSATSYPDSDKWVILDESVSSATDFAGMSAAIAALASSGRQISLEFPLLQSFPACAISGTTASDSSCTSKVVVSISAAVAESIGSAAFYSCESLESVSFPSVTSVDAWAFHQCTALKTASFPSLTTIGGAAFYKCTALASLELATADGVDLSGGSINQYAFNYSGVTTSSNIDLTVGSANSGCVADSTLTVGGVSTTFKSILFK